MLQTRHLICIFHGLRNLHLNRNIMTVFVCMEVCIIRNYIHIYRQISRIMRKPAFCICKSKDADQLCGNRTADQRLCFRYTDSTIPLLPKSKISSGCKARFMSDLVGNPEDRFCLDAAQNIYRIDKKGATNV